MTKLNQGIEPIKPGGHTLKCTYQTNRLCCNEVSYIKEPLFQNCAAGQHLCFRDTDSTIPLLPKSEFSSL